VDIIVGYALYLLVDSGSLSLTVPSPVRIGRIWDVTLWICVAVMAVGVNVALYLWSRFCRSNREKVDHKGVAEMVETAQGRDLTASEHAYYTFMALANAICEEISSRGLWRWYYRHIFWQEDSSSSPWASNMAQALVFGLWHYYGIPSGWTGVFLTTIYGLLLGYLADYADDGLFLPTVAHTIADYYIFAIVARQKKKLSKD